MKSEKKSNGLQTNAKKILPFWRPQNLQKRKTGAGGQDVSLWFIKSFLKDISKVSSITPSSSFVAERICREMDFSRDIVIVEYGPGNGVFGQAMLSRMTPGSRLIMIEMNSDFYQYLKENVTDPRVEIIRENALNIESILNTRGYDKVDYIVASIPFSFRDKQFNHTLLTNTRRALGDDGRFILCQYSFRVRKYLKHNFGRVRTGIELRNVPPMFIFTTGQGKST